MRRLLVIAMLLVGCRGGSSPSKSGSGSSGASGSGAPVAKGPHLELKVDGGAARTITVTGPTSLATLVPPSPAWLYVEATADDGRYLELSEPGKTYPGADVRLDVRDERVTVGVYRPPVTGVPADIAAIAAQPAVELTNVKAVEVWTHAPPAPARATVAIDIAGKPSRELDIADLDDVPEQNDRRMRGWLLRDVLATVSPNTKAAKVKIIGATEMTITSEQLAQLAVLKKNQRGELVFQMWEPGASRARDQVRSVKRIVVLATP